jgi:hypothetical protein
MSDEELSVSERLKRAAEGAQKASQQKGETPVDPLSFDNVKEKIAGKNSLLGSFGQSMYNRYRLVKNTYDTAEVIWNSKITTALTLGGSWATKKYWQGCKWAFNKYSTDKDGVYNKYKGAVAAPALAIFTAVAGYQVVTNAVPVAFRFAYDAAAVNMFAKEDTLMFSQPSPVEGAPNEFGVFACRQYPCEGQRDSIEFRMRDSIYLDVISFFEHFEPHDPGELAGAFISEENACNVTYYGNRWKYFGIHPYIIDATCIPVSGATTPEDALDTMRQRRLQP